MPDQPPELSIVIPLYNERENVQPLYAALTEALESIGRSYEIVVVDDGSSDGSHEELIPLSESDPRFKVVRFRRNYGQTAGFQAGFDHASGEVVITMDADLQNDPQDIPRLLAAMEENGDDVVSGRRMDRKEPFLTRKLPSQLANGLISRTTGVSLHDYGCSLKAYRREVVKNIRLYGEMHRYIPAIASMVGAKVSEIPVRDHPRVHGVSKYGLSHTLRVVLDLSTLLFLLKYCDRPMQFFGRLALASMGLGGLTALVALVAALVGASAGWALALGVLLIGSGLQFGAMGLLAEMAARTYFESQSKPVYVIRETHGL